MKKFALYLLFLATLAIGACTSEKPETEQSDINVERADSLRTAIAEKDSLIALFSEISESMNQIKQVENLLNTTNLTAETTSQKQSIIGDIALVKQALADRRQRLATLEARLSKSNSYTAEMQKTLENLKTQIALQEETILDLQKQLADANIKIENLNDDVDSLITQNAQVTIEKNAAQDESERLTNALNTCYYVIGSNKELKENKIIESGFLRKTKVMESEYEISYFTKADKRTLTEIPLNSKKAKVLSKHPANSYSIIETGETKTLVINNVNKFWELSNFLVVQVN